MQTVDQLLDRALGMRGRDTLYWLGSGGTDPASPVATQPLPIGRLWPGLPQDQRDMLQPLAEAAGLDLDDPTLVRPACDCSGFVCWALGFPRKALQAASWTSADGWISTDSIWQDAMGPQGLFVKRAAAAPGCLVVYPRLGSGHAHGHVGVVTEVDAQGHPTQVVHCSAGNFESAPFDAIKATDAEVFTSQAKSVFAWCKSVQP